MPVDLTLSCSVSKNSVSPDEGDDILGEAVEVTVTVQNDGDEDAFFTVEYYVDGTFDRDVDSQIARAGESGQTTQTFYWSELAYEHDSEGQDVDVSAQLTDVRTGDMLTLPTHLRQRSRLRA